jgi:hypothetical protein
MIRTDVTRMCKKGMVSVETEEKHKKPLSEQRFPSRDLNRVPPKYETGALPTRPCVRQKVIKASPLNDPISVHTIYMS